MAAEGMQFLWRRDGGTISLYLEVIWEMSVKAIFDAIRRLMEPPPEPPKRPIGYIYNE